MAVTGIAGHCRRSWAVNGDCPAARDRIIKQVTNLFWINVAFGAFLSLVILCTCAACRGVLSGSEAGTDHHGVLDHFPIWRV